MSGLAVVPIELPRVLFLGICLDFYYCLGRVLPPKLGALQSTILEINP